MISFENVSPFDDRGRVQMIVETPRGSSIKYKFDEVRGLFSVSRSLALGITYPFDWGFIPATRSGDGDALDALCLHRHKSFPGALLPCRCLGLIEVEQESSKGRVANPRLILAPDWEGAEACEIDDELGERARAEIEKFFLNATLFTSKNPRVLGWQDEKAARQLIKQLITP
jgi:inorganic pyrophosphatase